jgi:hypothetical protein
MKRQRLALVAKGYLGDKALSSSYIAKHEMTRFRMSNESA